MSKKTEKKNKNPKKLESDDFLGSLTVHKFEVKEDVYALGPGPSPHDLVDPLPGNGFDYGADATVRDKTFNR